MLRSCTVARTTLGWCSFDSYAAQSVRGSRRLSAGAETPRDVLRELSGSDVLHLSRRLQVLVEKDVSRHADLKSQADTSSLSSAMAKEMRALEPVALSASEAASIEVEIGEVRAMADEGGADSELAILANDEEVVLTGKLESVSLELVAALVERHVSEAEASDKKDSSKQRSIVEIRAGAGGDEASLFVTNLLTMYDKFASRNRWQTRVLSLSETSVGGVREIIMRFEGRDVYDRLKLEAGVHRVQRVPQTDSAGRVHTSTATVAVLRDDVSLHRTVTLNENDIRMDVYRASGAGGQHVNKTESAVRLTHIPTGLIAQSQEDRSQHRNRAIAMECLISRVAAKEAADAAAAKTAERHAQLGVSQGERSDRIRTYNFPQRRVTDHRIVTDSRLLDLIPSVGGGTDEKNADLDGVLTGTVELDRIMEAVKRQALLESVLVLVDACDAAERDSKRESEGSRASKRKSRGSS